jgi:hypothetical protein
MGPQPSIATAAFLIADPARAAMLMSLLDGRARPAGELAFAAGVTAQMSSGIRARRRSGARLRSWRSEAFRESAIVWTKKLDPNGGDRVIGLAAPVRR